MVPSLQILLSNGSAAGVAALLECYARAPGAALWLVSDRHQADLAIGRLSQAHAGLLSPGVKPLYQAADAVLASLPQVLRPVNQVQHAALIEQVLRRASVRGRRRVLAHAAETPGGVDLVAAAFRQFTHAGLSIEELRSQAKQQRDQRLVESVDAYADYRRLLAENGLADAAELLRLAADALESGRAGVAWKLMLVSGIDSPTPLELRLLIALLKQGEQRVVMMNTAAAQPNAASAAGADLPWPLLGPQTTVQRLRAVFPEASQERLTGHLGQKDLRRIALSRLFGDPVTHDPIAVARGDASLRVYPARGVQQEIEHAARHAKKLLLDGARPEEVVVASRRLADHAQRLREAFTKLGVPLAVEGKPSLAATPAGSAVGQLVRLAHGDWKFADLLSVVTRPQFTAFYAALEEPSWQAVWRSGFASRRAAVEWLLQELRYPGGREELMKRVEWLAQQHQQRLSADEEQDNPSARRRDRLGTAALVALEPLRALSELCESIGSRASALDWYDRLVDGLHAVGYRPPPEKTTEDDAALVALEEAFASLPKLAEWLGGSEPRLTLDDVQRLLRAWLPRTTVDTPWKSEGRVRALTAESAAGLSPEHLILIGLDEQSFPRGEGDAAPLSAGESQRHQSDEMLLFCQLLSAAQQTTTLSYTAVDEKAQKLNPSPFVAELLQLFPPDELTVDDTELGLLCEEDLRARAVSRLLDSDPAVLSQLLGTQATADETRGMCAGLAASYERSHGEFFGAYEGVLASPKAQEWTAKRFDAEHLWSASQLEQYAKCPFKFYLRHVVKADPLELLELEVDYRRRGSLLHDAMARFHRRVNLLVAEDAAASAVDPQEFIAAFQRAVEDACDALATAPHERAIVEIEAMQATAWAPRYRTQHEEYDQQHAGFDQAPRPAYFEARFGPAAGEDGAAADALSTETPFALDIGDQTVLLTGQVDRIDVGRVDGRLVFNVVDYKTAKTMTIRQEEIENGRLLQLVLYTIAVSDHLLAGQDATPWKTGYWVLQEKGFKTGKAPQPGEVVEGQLVLTEGWQELVARVRDTVGRIVRDVRAARFPMLNEDQDCGGRCEYRTVCRVAQARSLGKSMPESEERA